MTKLRVLLTGGTGFIGRPLCQRLLSCGFRVYVLSRKNISSCDEENLAYINTLNQLGNMPIDIVINLAGENISSRWTRAAKQAIYESRIMFTRALIDYMKQSSKKPMLLINASAVGYYGTDPDQVFDENSPVDQAPQGFAQYLCQAWEKEAMHAQALGVRVVLLRIGPVLDKDGGILSKLLPSFRWGLGGRIGDGKQWFSWIDRDDLINMVMFLIDHPEIQGPINATSPFPVSNEVFSQAFAYALKKPCLCHLPGFVIRCLFGQMGEEIMLQGQKVLPSRITQQGFSFLYPDIRASLEKVVMKLL